MGFDIRDFLNNESTKAIVNDFTIKKINVELLDPSKEDFYSIIPEEVIELADSIELVGLQQNLVVTPKDNGRYEIKTGRKRYMAIKELIRRGNETYINVPCKIEQPDTSKNELVMIFTNSTQRVRSDYEKMKEIERLKVALKEYKKSHKVGGNTDEIIAKILGTSKSTVGRLENINNNLIEPLKEEYAGGKINTSTANKLASKDEKEQQQAYNEYKETGTVTIGEVKEAVELAETKAVEKPIDKENLIIDGRINDNKEYAEGVTVKTVKETIMHMQILDYRFYIEWLATSNDNRIDLLEQYAGITEEIDFIKIENKSVSILITDLTLEIKYGLKVTQIPFADVREIVNDLITTGRITVRAAVEQTPAVPEKSTDQQILKALKTILESRNLLTEQEKCALMSIARNVKEREAEE